MSKSTLASHDDDKQTSTSTNKQTSSSPLSFRHAYGPRLVVGLTFAEQGKTKQSFRDECDINVIMRRFEQTGELPLNQRPMLFGDCPDLDFQGAMQVVTGARERFMALPSDIRDRFANDPQRLISFISDPGNREEAERLGLVQKRQDRAPGAPATPVPAPPSATQQAQSSQAPGGTPTP